MTDFLNQTEYNNRIKSTSPNELKQATTELTSDRDMVDYLGKSAPKHILKYSQLKNYRYITYLLKYNGDFKIILFEQSPNTGHWCLLLRYNDTIEFFDPYGKPPLYSLNYSKQSNEQLDQRPEYLSKLLNQNKFKVIYNKYPFQSPDPNISTCGKHLLLRLSLFKEKGYDLLQYITFFENRKRKYKLSNDKLVALLIPLNN